MKSSDQKLVMQAISRLKPPLKIEYQDDNHCLVIRPMEAKDAAMLQQAIRLSHTELTRYMEWAHRPLDLNQQIDRLIKTRQDYFSGKDYQMGVFDGKNGEFLMGTGWSSPSQRNPAALEIGYWTVTSHSGKGLATLVTQVLTVIAIECLACDRVEIMVNAENSASRKVLEKCGFQQEGTIRNGNMAPPAALIRDHFCPDRTFLLFSFIPSDRRKVSWYEEVLSRIRLTANIKK